MSPERTPEHTEDKLLSTALAAGDDESVAADRDSDAGANARADGVTSGTEAGDKTAENPEAGEEAAETPAPGPAELARAADGAAPMPSGAHAPDDTDDSDDREEELPLPAASVERKEVDPPAVAAGGGDGGDLPPAVTHAQDAGQPAPPPNEEPMTLMGHLNELRRRLTRVVIMVLIGFIACYGVAEPIYGWLSEPLKAALPEGSKLIYTSPQGAFFVYLKVALVTSIFVTSPFTFYQLWAFIAPGLYKEEKQAIAPLAFFSAFFFLAGASFCYFLVFPLAFQFFMGFATDVIIPMISVEEYLSFALKLLIAFGLVFEMPLFAYFLAKMGLLTPDMMRRQRKYAILAMFVTAAILTPPDVFSQCLMAAPMLILYEVSIHVAASARKKRDAKHKDKEADAQAESPEGASHDDA